jgi:hypothetical protein
MDVLSIIVSGMAITTTISGWIAVSVKGIKVRTELDLNTKNDLIKLKEDVASIKKVVSNGGLKDAIGQIQANCGKEMTRVLTVMENHIEQPSHPGVSESLARIDERLRNMEKEQERVAQDLRRTTREQR